MNRYRQTTSIQDLEIAQLINNPSESFIKNEKAITLIHSRNFCKIHESITLKVKTERDVEY